MGTGRQQWERGQLAPQSPLPAGEMWGEGSHHGFLLLWLRGLAGYPVYAPTVEKGTRSGWRHLKQKEPGGASRSGWADHQQHCVGPSRPPGTMGLSENPGIPKEPPQRHLLGRL